MQTETPPWWTTRYDAMARIDPAFAGAVDAYAEAQVELIERLAGLHPGDAVLDLGCGAGRHCILLQERGYLATGVDISARLLALAQDRWARRHPGRPGPEFLEGDMRAPPTDGPYDAAVLMDESLGVFEQDVDHLATLAAVAQRLREGGRLVLELFNPYYWAHRSTTLHYPPGALAEEVDLVRTYRFDPVRGRVEDRVTVFRAGERVELPTQSLRAWAPTELVAMLQAAGFAQVRVYGSDGWEVPAEPVPLDARRSAFMWVLGVL